MNLDRSYLQIVLSLMIALSLVACNTEMNPDKEISEEQKVSDAFIEKIAKEGKYTRLLFPNENTPIYYKEVKDALPENKGKRPFQNSIVKVAIRAFLANTGEEIIPLTKDNLIIFTQDQRGKVQSQTPGLQFALQNMEVGDEWEIIVPWKLAYGAYTMGTNIPEYANLEYHITLLEITKQ